MRMGSCPGRMTTLVGTGGTLDAPLGTGRAEGASGAWSRRGSSVFSAEAASKGAAVTGSEAAASGVARQAMRAATRAPEAKMVAMGASGSAACSAWRRGRERGGLFSFTFTWTRDLPKSFTVQSIPIGIMSPASRGCRRLGEILWTTTVVGTGGACALRFAAGGAMGASTCNTSSFGRGGGGGRGRLGSFRFRRDRWRRVTGVPPSARQKSRNERAGCEDGTPGSQGQDRASLGPLRQGARLRFPLHPRRTDVAKKRSILQRKTWRLQRKTWRR